MMEQEILDLGAQQIPYFRTDDFSEIMFENEFLIKKFVKAPEGSRAIFLTGSGTAAMEAAVINVFDKTDKLLIINGGSFGARFKAICDVHMINNAEILLAYGEPLKEEHLAPYDNQGFTGLLINVHETSTGVLYDMGLVKDFAKRNGLILMVDAIGSFLADPFDMQESETNVTIISSQKGLALPPGMSFVVVDEIAIQRILVNNIISYYFDFKKYLQDGQRGQTPFTPAVSTLIQLRHRLICIDTLGIDQIIANVALLAQDFRNKIKKLPFEIFTESVSNAISPLSPIGKTTAYEIFSCLKNNYNIYVCPNGGDLKDSLFRVGHIGALTVDDNNKLVDALLEMEARGLL